LRYTHRGSQDRATPTSARLARTYPGCARSTAAAQALALIVTTSLRGRPRRCDPQL